MNIKDTFIKLTDRTYPHGTEQELFHLLDESLQEDEFGNLFTKIGDSDVMFTSHLDTATKALSPVVHIFDGDIIKTDGTSILGADDKAGVTIMLYMIKNKIPGLYYFFLGEEVGCVGSRKVATAQKKEKLEYINKVISFDRRSTDSIITFQSSQRCCSDAFGDALANAFNEVDETFNYKTDKGGVLTDSKQFTSIYPECTNISVGYYSEHTMSERQDIVHLDKLAQACIKINWEILPVERDASTTEYDSYDRFYTGCSGIYGPSYGYGSGAWEESEPRSTKKYQDFRKSYDKTIFHDELFNYVSYIETDAKTGKITSVDLNDKRVLYEEQIIKKLLEDMSLTYYKMKWDGMILTVNYEEDIIKGYTTTCDRNDLLDYLPELDYREVETLGDYEDSNYIT